MRKSLFILLSYLSFRPLSRQIGSYTLIRYNKMKTPKLFPAPLEVDRYLYTETRIIDDTNEISFRPLSRQIGIYTDIHQTLHAYQLSFPAPLEVDRYLYNKFDFKVTSTYKAFPAPREVDRYLYVTLMRTKSTKLRFRPLARQIGNYTIAELVTPPAPVEFPAPREVDRYLYAADAILPLLKFEKFPAPLEEDRYLYQRCLCLLKSCKIVSGPSRGRQVGSYTGKGTSICEILRRRFPSPREVDRYLYGKDKGTKR